MPMALAVVSEIAGSYLPLRGIAGGARNDYRGYRVK